MDGQQLTCATCDGRKFTPQVLDYTLDGLSIADIDDLTIDDAIDRLPTLAARLAHLADVGLGYLTLGRPLTTLSGGESQRLKIAKHLHDTIKPETYVLDEPTTGLHIDDIDTLLHVLDQLLDHGHTIVVVEHNLDVIAHADWIIDLGPGPGRHGGTITHQGPVDTYTDPTTPTGHALAEHRQPDLTTSKETPT